MTSVLILIKLSWKLYFKSNAGMLLTTHAITSVNGHLGRLLIDALLERGVILPDITAFARTSSKAMYLSEWGVKIRKTELSIVACQTVRRALGRSGRDHST
ncbi:MAG: hypothetical protein WA090_03840 [Candidatus Nanopelagicaceae bacterium]